MRWKQNIVPCLSIHKAPLFPKQHWPYLHQNALQWSPWSQLRPPLSNNEHNKQITIGTELTKSPVICDVVHYDCEEGNLVWQCPCVQRYWDLALESLWGSQHRKWIESCGVALPQSFLSKMPLCPLQASWCGIEQIYDQESWVEFGGCGHIEEGLGIWHSW